MRNASDNIDEAERVTLASVRAAAATRVPACGHVRPDPGRDPPGGDRDPSAATNAAPPVVPVVATLAAVAAVIVIAIFATGGNGPGPPDARAAIAGKSDPRSRARPGCTARPATAAPSR